MRRRCYNCKTDIYGPVTIYERLSRISCRDCVKLRQELMENMGPVKNIAAPLKGFKVVLSYRERLEN